MGHRNVALRGVERAAARAGLGRVTPHDLRSSFCSLAGRRGVDPVEAAQITGHSPAVWARFYARSFGKAQREEARDRLLEHGFGAPSEEDVLGPLAPRSHGRASEPDLTEAADAAGQETPANEEFPTMERTGIEPVTSGLQSSTRPYGVRLHGRGLPARAGLSSVTLRGLAGAGGAFRRPRAGYVRDEVVAWSQNRERTPSDSHPGPLLTMRSDRQLVATGGNGFGLFEPQPVARGNTRSCQTSSMGASSR
jgi:hypothetical protein